MVPFADFINHNNVDSSYEMISKNINPRTHDADDCSKEINKAYFTKTKAEVDYSDFYKKVQATAEVEETKELMADT
jgi:penicillin-binding protein-related factor A (putative recombinase)